MSFGVFAQIFVDIVFLAGLFTVFARLRRPQKDDPRLSKGLQLLSSKIAVLEDLNDRTEAQVQQMLELLDQKSKELQSKVFQAEQHVGAVQVAMAKSLEVSKIFQDKIPHDEIIERQQSMKYIKAARLAHAGQTAEQISNEIDLPISEIEFIAKVNRESLTFREEDLPEWAREPAGYAPTAAAQPSPSSPLFHSLHSSGQDSGGEKDELVRQLSKLQFEMQTLDLELASRRAPASAAEANKLTPQNDMAVLGQTFRQAVREAEASAGDLERARAEAMRLAEAEAGRTKAIPIAAPVGPVIRKVQFPRIDSKEM